MKPLNFVLTGVGGQGIVLASDILCLVGMAAGYDVKKTDVHGMAQRGGSVISHVRLADQVFSPMVPVGSEKLEACRWTHYLRRDGVAVVSDEAIPTLAMESKLPYPADDEIVSLLRQHAGQVQIVPAGRLAAELGHPRIANVILLAALSRFVDIPAEVWLNAIAERVPPRFRELNRRAFELGRSLAIA